jgi:UDP-N-acetylglucosamine 2-epimerase (non-hydrolysing)
VPLLAIAGTRPEVLKLAPVVRAIDAAGGRLSVKVCLSGQHGALARDIAGEIGLPTDFDLGAPAHAMERESAVSSPMSLSESLAKLLGQLSELLASEKPRGVLVQGDTTTALAGSLSAFHLGIPSFHVEAGLRTSDPTRPFPEEMNRRLVSRLATLHFAPTEHAQQNLVAEGVPSSNIFVTGNTVVDALAAFGAAGVPPVRAKGERRSILVTLHRREGAADAASVARAIAELGGSGADVVWIRHPNRTSESALAALGDEARVTVLPPQPYAAFVALMRRAHVILTDSGGIQEEAPVLGVPVVVLRSETDRPEAVAAGNAVVVGADPAAIAAACRELLDDPAAHERRSRATSPFGDGGAAPRIVSALERYFASVEER